jgi:capsular polysaccharide export protein
MHESAQGEGLKSADRQIEWDLAHNQAEGRVFLFLQGPNCSFFTGIADRLESLGHRCLRVNLCFGDWLFWRRKGALNYRGSFHKWESFLSNLMDNERVTDVLMLGEQREYHKVATRLAKTRGIEVTVTDFGYLRPDWITLEKNGMSGDSLFPKDRKAIEELAAEVPEPEFTDKFKSSFAKMAFAEVLSACSSWILRFLYPGYRSHHIDNPIIFYSGIGLRLLRAKKGADRTHQFIGRLSEESSDRPFFLFPMQMEMDFQIRAYSPYENQMEPICEVISSFAQNAARESRLVFKIHPMDPGLVNWKKKIWKRSLTAGVSERVFFVDGGSLEKLLEKCSGVVTINSTVGVTALQFGKAVKTLGSAVYDIKGLTYQESINEFWGSDHEVDTEFRDVFIRALAGTIQLRGGFFDPVALSHVVGEASKRLDQRRINKA